MCYTITNHHWELLGSWLPNGWEGWIPLCAGNHLCVELPSRPGVDYPIWRAGARSLLRTNLHRRSYARATIGHGTHWGGRSLVSGTRRTVVIGQFCSLVERNWFVCEARYPSNQKKKSCSLDLQSWILVGLREESLQSKVRRRVSGALNLNLSTSLCTWW